ncbi:MAG TPA: CHAT domain-containing protein [Thermoanaerobaculia bacterium]|nr:CHAT domain-containing protein [Thermoanaerobaculia bacterium]
MRVLRLRQSLTAGGGSLVAVDYDPGQGASSHTSKVPLLFELNEYDRSRLRFYLEDFLICPDPAALKPAADLRDDLRRWGEELFRQVFKTDRKALFHYEEAARDLHSLRIEIFADQPDAWKVPWELLYDPNLGWLAPQVRSFARLPATSQREPEVPFLPVPGDPLRVLYVVGRPAGSLEIPFHSVARPLLQTAAELEDRLRIDFLRPPTFERLAKVLSEAAEADRPYHVLHFDGHGVYTDSPQDFSGEVDPGFVQEGDRLLRRSWTKRRGGARGYLIFEDLEGAEARRLVDGVLIGNLMARTRTPLLVLHACQSATARTLALERMAGLAADATVGEAPDDHDQDLALQALAAEVMRSSPRAAVALPWTLPPATATRLLAGLYTRIAGGAPVSEAAGSVRAELLHGVRKESVLGNVEVDDWLVPVVYEASPLPLCDPGSGRRKRARMVPDDLPDDSQLPDPPPWGFVERPEVLFTLDRAFDVHGAVLLHALAGAGKTSLARELALWYRQSGGLRPDKETELEEPGILLWSSFEGGYSPRAPFDAFERAFAGRLMREGVWAGASPEERREIALQILREVPSFWVWDGVEQIEEEDRLSLADLLRDLGETRCKVLLVGRRPEGEWLGSLPYRIALPPMPMEERGELTIRIAARHGLALRDLMSFAPLLRFSQGNPLTLSFLLNEALRQECRQPGEVDAFLSALRLEEGSELLGGYERAFGEKERQRLALLHLFQGHVDLNVLCWMGHPEAPWCLPPVRNLGRGPWASLLDRAVQAGLLISRGKDCYGFHPALPLFLRGWFERFWKEADLAAARAFAESMAGLGSYCHREFQAGNRDVMAGLLAQEANLLHARTLARDNGWWSAVVNAMQGLETLYLQTGRQEEWKRLVRETVPELVDPETEQPLPGREELRDAVNGFLTEKKRG